MATQTEVLLEVLLDAGVEFIVVGGIAAVAHGAITPTQDLDVAAPLTEENLNRLMTAIRPYHPRHATRPDLGEVWQTPAQLTKFRLLLLQTDLGRLDVLGRVEPLGDFSSLRSVQVELVEGRMVDVLELSQLLEVKAHLNRPKDKVVEAELRAIVELLDKGNQDDAES